jgi:putative transposon-encoded protein
VRINICRGIVIVVTMLLVGAVLPGGSFAQEGASPDVTTPDVTTAGYNTLRDDWDANEPGLSPAAVQSAGFGEIFSTKVAGAVYAQPLAYKGSIIVTTEKARAYAINATSGAVEWSRDFGKPFPASAIGCGDLKPFIGSTSTPVIDPSTGTVYMTTRLEEGGGGLAHAHWTLQAFSAETGVERPGFPVPIKGTPGNTPGVPFNESYEQQRPGLLLLNGVVYVAFASDCDFTPYRGIVAGYSAANGSLSYMWSDESGVGTNEDSQAGIWQSGGGLVSDGPQTIVLATGNGVSPQPAPSNAPPPTLSESVVQLTVGASGALTPTEFFAPSNAPTMDENDEDLGSGGPIALPKEYFGTKAIPQLIVQVGKDGRVFLINQNNMGGYRQGAGKSDAVLQTLGPFAGVWGHPAAYGGQGGWVYILESAGGGYLQALSYGLNGKGEPALSVAGTSSESFGYTSGSPLVTSNGTTNGSAVVWVVYTNGPEAAAENGRGSQLRAYAAMPTGGTLPLLWSAPIGRASKFDVPTAYDGRVYVGTRTGRLIAFGPSAEDPVEAAPVSLGSVPVGESSTATLTVTAAKTLSFTGPVTAGGNQGADGPVLAAKLPRHGATAGPSKIPPSGESSLAAGVIAIQQPRLATAIPAGTRLQLKVRFTPRHAGPVVAVAYSRTSAGTRTVTVSGYGTRPGLISSAQPLSFRKVRTRVGGKTLTLTFTNSSIRSERITSVRLPRAPFHVLGMPAVGTVLAPRQAVTVSVHFDPARAGSYRSELHIATDHGSLTLPTSGVAVTGTAHLAPSALRIAFGHVKVGSSRTITFTVGNSGNVPLTITRAIAPIGVFSTTQQLPEGIVIEPGVLVRQTITFRPVTKGRVSARYELNSNDGQGAVFVTFTGTGT